MPWRSTRCASPPHSLLTLVRPPSAAPAADATSGEARRTARRQAPKLTGRQREIARLIAEGRTNRQIARQLVLTEGTVANHVRAILLRLDVRCRAQVADWNVSEGVRRAS